MGDVKVFRSPIEIEEITEWKRHCNCPESSYRSNAAQDLVLEWLEDDMLEAVEERIPGSGLVARVRRFFARWGVRRRCQIDREIRAREKSQFLKYSKAGRFNSVAPFWVLCLSDEDPRIFGDLQKLDQYLEARIGGYADLLQESKHGAFSIFDRDGQLIACVQPLASFMRSAYTVNGCPLKTFLWSAKQLSGVIMRPTGKPGRSFARN